MQDYIEAKREKKFRSRISEDRNFLGIGVGCKEVDGQLTSSLAVRLYVQHKRPKKDLTSKEMMPTNIGSMPTDVIKMAPLRARGSFTKRVRPLVGGCSGCVEVPGLNYTGTLGLGMRGFGGFADKIFVLSNNHVLANENRSHIGDPVIQPGRLDGGDPATDTVGSLFDFVPLAFSDPSAPNPTPNQVDAACAEITEFGDMSREIFWVGYPKGWRTRQSVQDAVLTDSRVQKTGRTTGFTTGIIADVAFDGFIGYDAGAAFFEDQLLITPGTFSDAGDSGSCILDMAENIVGLLFAGSATHTIANYIEDVWMELPPIDFSDGIV